MHFFALFIAVFGRADATDLDYRGDYVQDRQYFVLRDAMAIRADLRLALFTLIVAVFVHPELVVKPGIRSAWRRVSVSTIGITFSLTGNILRAKSNRLSNPVSACRDGALHSPVIQRRRFERRLNRGTCHNCRVPAEGKANPMQV